MVTKKKVRRWGVNQSSYSTREILEFDTKLIELSLSSSSLLSRVRISQYLTRAARELNQLKFKCHNTILFLRFQVAQQRKAMANIHESLTSCILRGNCCINLLCIPFVEDISLNRSSSQLDPSTDFSMLTVAFSRPSTYGLWASGTHGSLQTFTDSPVPILTSAPAYNVQPSYQRLRPCEQSPSLFG